MTSRSDVDGDVPTVSPGSQTWKKDARYRSRLVTVTARLTFRLRADEPEWAIRDACDDLKWTERSVMGTHVDHGSYEHTLVDVEIVDA